MKLCIFTVVRYAVPTPDGRYSLNPESYREQLEGPWSSREVAERHALSVRERPEVRQVVIAALSLDEACSRLAYRPRQTRGPRFGCLCCEWLGWKKP
jgi:hypothetical protein